MSNSCYTEVVFKGTKENLDKLEEVCNTYKKQHLKEHKKVKKVSDKINNLIKVYKKKNNIVDDRDYSIHDKIHNYRCKLNREMLPKETYTYFAPHFLIGIGCINRDLLNKFTKDKISFRSTIISLDRTSDEEFWISLEEAWYPHEAIYKLIASKFNLTYVFSAEEPGNGVYINTDITGKYFPYNYVLNNCNDEINETDCNTYGNGIKSCMIDNGAEELGLILNIAESEEYRYYFTRYISEEYNKDVNISCCSFEEDVERYKLMLAHLQDFNSKVDKLKTMPSIELYKEEIARLNNTPDEMTFIFEMLNDFNIYIEEFDTESSCAYSELFNKLIIGEISIDNSKRNKRKRAARLKRKRKLRK